MKLKGREIIIFGLPRFDSEIESTNFTMAKILARENKVYYIENPFTLKDYFRFRHGKQHENRKGYYAPWSTAIKDTEIANLKVVVPPVLLSINFLPEGFLFRSLLKVNEFLLKWKLKTLIKSRNIKDFVFINSFNFHYPNVIRGFAPVVKVYHCLDPLILPFDSRHGIISEEILVRDSDVVLCSARQLYLEKKIQNPSTYFVPNAADITHSSKALDADLKVKELIANIAKPIVGYFGAIERRIDYVLLEKVIAGNQDKQFVFVGPVFKEYIPESLGRFANVHFTGPVPYEALPSVIKGFDVALIPFKKDEVSRTIFPLKLFEYLGAGKPVVAIDFNPDLKEFTGNAVRYCADAAEFSAAINEVLVTDSAAKKEERVAIATENTWDRRIDQMAEIIASHIRR